METENILISEDYVFYNNREDKDDGKGYRSEGTGVYESFTDDRGELFRSLLREYGRCISRMYVDGLEKPIGWVFLKRNDDGSYRETWISLHEKKPETKTTYHYATSA